MVDIKHLDAFEYYYSLGSARSYEKVAQKFNRSEKTVNTWGYKEKWAEEVRYRDTEQLKENRRQSLISRRSSASKYQKLVDGSLKVYLEELKKGRIKVETVKDLDTLVKLACYLDDFVLDGEDRIIGETVEEQSAGDVNNSAENEKIEIIFDLNGGVSSED